MIKEAVVNDDISADYSAMDPYSDYTASAANTNNADSGIQMKSPRNGSESDDKGSRRFSRSMTHPHVQPMARARQNDKRRKRQASDDFINELEKVR